MQHFTPIPAFARYLDTFLIEEGENTGDESDLVVSCTTCLDTVVVLTPGMAVRRMVAAVTEHRCDA